MRRKTSDRGECGRDRYLKYVWEEQEREREGNLRERGAGNPGSVGKVHWLLQGGVGGLVDDGWMDEMRYHLGDGAQTILDSDWMSGRVPRVTDCCIESRGNRSGRHR